MYYLEKTLEISAAHWLDLDRPSPCSQMHGHNWRITVFCKRETLGMDGMIIDFGDIKKAVYSFDHETLNNLPVFSRTTNRTPPNPTAENIAKILCSKIPYCYRVEVEETSGNKAIYEKDDL